MPHITFTLSMIKQTDFVKTEIVGRRMLREKHYELEENVKQRKKVRTRNSKDAIGILSITMGVISLRVTCMNRS